MHQALDDRANYSRLVVAGDAGIEEIRIVSQVFEYVLCYFWDVLLRK